MGGDLVGAEANSGRGMGALPQQLTGLEHGALWCRFLADSVAESACHHGQRTLHRTSGDNGIVALARFIGQASGAALVALCFNLLGKQGACKAMMLGALTAGPGAMLSMARLRAR